MKITQFPHMPATIKVKIMKHTRGDGFFAELTDYDVFTEAETAQKLDEMINDLIYELFEVPVEYQYKIKYITEDGKDKELEKVKNLIVMSTPDLYKKYIS